jgi:hypothetical protein
MQGTGKKGPAKPDRDFHPRDHPDTGLPAGRQSRFNSLERIVVGDGNGAKAQFLCFVHQLSGGEITIRGPGVVVQIRKYRMCHDGFLLAFSRVFPVIRQKDIMFSKTCTRAFFSKKFKISFDF